MNFWSSLSKEANSIYVLLRPSGPEEVEDFSMACVQPMQFQFLVCSISREKYIGLGVNCFYSNLMR